MYDGYMCFGGTELINMGRTSQFIADGRGPEGLQCRGCGPCPGLNAGLGFPDGYGIGDAPWYDPAVPESADFAGLLVTSVTGLEPGPFVREFTEKVGSGSVAKQGRQTTPTITVTGILMGATCCAVEYGLQWYRSALRGGCNSTSLCAGDDLTVLNCFPVFNLEDRSADADCIATCNGNPDCLASLVADDPVALLPSYYRTFKGAALISSPTTRIIPRGCPECYDCGLTEITFVIGAAKPCIYAEPVTILDNASFSCSSEDDDDCIVWLTPEAALALGVDCLDIGDCADDPNCGTDPNCDTTLTPPTIALSTNNCTDDCDPVTTCTACVDIPAGTFPVAGEGTLVITITAGALDMRNIRIKVWPNPLELDPDLLEDCDLCSTLNVSFVAAHSTLVIDGANRTSTITCLGGSAVRANPFISSAGNSPSFGYPSIDGCVSNTTVCVTVGGTVAADAAISIDAVPMYC